MARWIAITTVVATVATVALALEGVSMLKGLPSRQTIDTCVH